MKTTTKNILAPFCSSSVKSPKALRIEIDLKRFCIHPFFLWTTILLNIHPFSSNIFTVASELMVLMWVHKLDSFKVINIVISNWFWISGLPEPHITACAVISCMEPFYVFFSLVFVLVENNSPTSSADPQNAATWFCCEAREMFCVCFHQHEVE